MPRSGFVFQRQEVDQASRIEPAGRTEGKRPCRTATYARTPEPTFSLLVALAGEGRGRRNLHFPTGAAKLLAAGSGRPGDGHVPLEASELAGWIRRLRSGRVARVVISPATSNAWSAQDPRKRESVEAFKLAELRRWGRVPGATAG
jgi:hypothetical protein